MKIAIVHDYLVNRGGAERVVAVLHRIFPDAPIFTGLYAPEATYPEFAAADIRPSKLQRLLRDPEDFRRLAPLMPRTFRKMKIEGFDVVLSSTSGFAHGVKPKNGCHIAYTYTPPRFLWDDGYERANAVSAPLRPLSGLAVRAMRRADRRAAERPHFTVAISTVAAERVRAIYGREATIIHPPVETGMFGIAPNTKDEFLLVSRLLTYKNVDVAIRAFNQLGRTLIIVGDGPARADLEAIAGPTIEFRGVVEDAELVRLYGRCRGTILAASEDFGLTPLEANASGRPVVALRSGGAEETVIDGTTGVFFSPANPLALADAVNRAVHTVFDPVVLRAHAEQFGVEAFEAKIRGFIEQSRRACMTCHRERRAGKVRHLRTVAPGTRDEGTGRAEAKAP
ncbi:MAG TPA: glycosyltransferase [Actinomycetota bacterium]|nr:glycosyltransferase [Actinomycetota bacterium]